MCSERYDYDDALCRALADEGCEVELVTAPFAYHPWPEARGYLRRELFAPGAGTGGFLHRSLRRLQRAVAYPRAWRRLVGELAARPPAIVHLQWSLATTGRSAASAAPSTALCDAPR